MAQAKFVSAKLPKQYAEDLHKIQNKMAKLQAQLDELAVEERQLSSYLLKISKGTSFTFDSGDYQKLVRITNHRRMILDQERAREILKSKTPYKPSEWTTVKVDFIYETEKKGG